MHTFALFGEVLLVLALIGLIGVLIWLTIAVSQLKNAAISNAGRLYKRPLNASKNLIATSKGIVQQESVRLKHVGTSVKGASSAVKSATAGIKTAAQTIHPEELGPTLAALQNLATVAGVVTQFSQAAGA